MTQLQSLSRAMTYQLRPDVDVYRYSDQEVVFRRGETALRYTSHSLALKIESVITVLEAGVRQDQLDASVLTSVGDKIDVSNFISSLLSNNLLQVTDENGTCSAALVSELETMALPDGYAESTANSLQQFVRLLVIAADPLADRIKAIAREYGIKVSLLDMEVQASGKLHLDLPDQSDGRRDMMILFLGNLDEYYREELALHLTSANIEYVPIVAEERGRWRVGPAVCESGPCMHCVESRRLGNRNRPELVRLLAHDNTRQVRMARCLLTPATIYALAQTSMMLAIQHLSRPADAYTSRCRPVHLVQPADPAITTHMVYKNPYCPACSPALKLPGRRDFRDRNQAGQST